jgi:hypothetical protein
VSDFPRLLSGLLRPTQKTLISGGKFMIRKLKRIPLRCWCWVASIVVQIASVQGFIFYNIERNWQITLIALAILLSWWSMLLSEWRIRDLLDAIRDNKLADFMGRSREES